MMKVRDCYTTITKEADLVRKTDTLPEIMRKLSENPISRSVFVVDEGDKLVGIITVLSLFRVIRSDYLQEDAFTLYSEVSAQTAEDIMVEAVSVSLDDDIETALKEAIHNGLEDLPVTKDGKVIGELNCFEILGGIGIEGKL